MDSQYELNLNRFDEDATVRRREFFVADPNLYLYRRYPELQEPEVITAKKGSQSVLDVTGVRFKKTLENGKTEKFFACLQGKCFQKREVIKLTNTSTSNGSRHLKEAHHVLSAKTQAYHRNVAQLNQYIEGASEAFQQDPNRWFEVQLAAFACENSLAFRAFESTTWKVIAEKLPVMKNKTLQKINIKKHYVEHYVSIKQHIQAHIEAAKTAYHIPFMSLTIDLIQTKVQNKKLIGVKVTYIHNGSIVSWNLAVRAYNPTAQQMEGERKASDLLMDWCKVILKEYSINPEKHILTSCSDSGSDVKRALEVVFPTHREWCVSHLTHLALADAFGSSVDPNKTKNSEIR
jgi:hypothetical protein